MSKSYHKKSDLPRNTRDLNKDERRLVRDRLKNGEYDDLNVSEFRNRRLHSKDTRE